MKRTVFSPSRSGMILTYVILGLWAVIILFPLYWVAITSLKLPIAVFAGPFYVPFLDFQPSGHAWKYIFVDVRRDVFRPYANTVFVATVSSLLALLLGSSASYALARFVFRPKVGVIGLFIGCVSIAALATYNGVPWIVAVAGAAASYILLFLGLARRFRKTLGNSDIAFWLISQRMLPPVVVVVPIYVMFQQIGLLDTLTALVIAYVAANLPIVVWLMRDYFESVPIELEECAAIDGATRYRILFSIVLPLAVPGLVSTFLFVLVFSWNEYLLSLFLTGARSQTLPLMVAGQNATRGPEWWYMSVLILIMILPVIGLAIALDRYIARGLLVGAIKG